MKKPGGASRSARFSYLGRELLDVKTAVPYLFMIGE
jgi:hypothetical protein